MPSLITSDTSVHINAYIFDPRPRLPFRIAAKRYWVGEHCPDTDEPTISKTRKDALTLVFLHGSGASKEHWEPTIRRLFEHKQTDAQRTVQFHDMWSLDMPNHGDSAILNEDVLRWGYETFWWEYNARCLHAFLAGLGTGVDVDFSERTLALVGHSMGAPTSMFATTYHPLLKISSLHMIEPCLAGEEAHKSFGWQYEAIAGKRKDTWLSREEVLQTLKTRPLLRTWDDRIHQICAEHCVRPLPTTEYPDLNEGVTLKCTKRQESATYRDRVAACVAYKYLPYVLKEIPTHIAYGMVHDFMPEEYHRDVLQIASGGISNFASVTWVPEAGHMILQTHPDAVADLIWKSLTQYQYHGSSLKDIAVAKL